MDCYANIFYKAKVRMECGEIIYKTRLGMECGVIIICKVRL